jgi:sulfotransferase family protein
VTRLLPLLPYDAGMKRAVNRVLAGASGYQFTRAVASAPLPATPPPVGPRKRVDRLVKSPVFILCSVRSGSTLLRVILNSHSQICAPHELHLRYMRVSIDQEYGEIAMKQIGMDERKLEHLLWDRVLERELTASGKRVIVDKTPNIVFMWERLREAWPSARFIFLFRHPAAIANSVSRDRSGNDGAYDYAVKRVREYAAAIEAARAVLPGYIVRYEELVAEPERVSAGVCEFLGLTWEPTMLDYGSHDHGKLVPRIGDWGEKIRSGRIDSNITVPGDDEVPPQLEDVSRAWGYLD